ncbi:MAG: squalene--hopene cyclase [Desulfovibrionales bacterium]
MRKSESMLIQEDTSQDGNDSVASPRIHNKTEFVHDLSVSPADKVERSVRRGCEMFLSRQAEEGFWVYDLEADCTIPAEYLLLQRFLRRETDPGTESSIVQYLRNSQLPDGGWSLYEEGHADLSATVKAYFALKIFGDTPDMEHMVRARRLVLSMGGAAKANVFTRITLALFGQIPWRTTPAMPVEIMLLPSWFFFHLEKVSYWARTVIVPLLILYARRPVCRLRYEESIPELFISPPESHVHVDGFTSGNLCRNCFILLDRTLKKFEPFFPRATREKAIRNALSWTRERMQGEGGIGGIFPAMANGVMAMKVEGVPEDDPGYQRGLKAVDDLLTQGKENCFCQPCLSPVWDTCLSLSALLEAGMDREHQAIKQSVDWLFQKQIFKPGDWSRRNPKLAPGAWAFQFENTYYPDVDDTSMVLMGLIRAGCLDKKDHRERFSKAVNWLLGLQSSDGGWGAFDVDNNRLYLNNIPFADHGALLDPSTSDLTGRCVELLSLLGFDRTFPPIARGLRFLRKEQEEFGGWYGRWGVNYIYGTWSVLMGLRQAGEDMRLPYVRRAVDWLKTCQNPDGGWGETCYTYNDPAMAGQGPSTASQTAWALLGLMAAGEERSATVRKGVNHLVAGQTDQGGWQERHYTGTGFPRVFYLRYHGYSQYFPLWALGVYKRLLTEGLMLEDSIRRKTPADLDLPLVS